MDERLERIRRYEANVKDFDSYMNDKIRETKNMNENASIDYQKYGLEPSEIISNDCLNYIINNIYNFDRRYSIALDKIGRLRIPLKQADPLLFDEILNIGNEYQEENNGAELMNEDIEELFG